MEPQLRARGIARMQMFGSRARGDEQPDSDLDLLVDLDPLARFSLLDLSGIHLDLTEQLGIEAYPTIARSKGERFRLEIAPDLVPVF